MWICVGRTDATVSTAQSSGAAVLPVTAASGMSVGDVLAVCLEDRTTQWTACAGKLGQAQERKDDVLPRGKSVGTF
ncbi:hypothetical protein [Paenibacillus sp. GCM10012303]|uniref:hypothetical protein n=1 Tax=Paenibacillus sp. GCM10012303 TaxID=3317340 RepID=UPI0036D3C9D6